MNLFQKYPCPSRVLPDRDDQVFLWRLGRLGPPGMKVFPQRSKLVRIFARIALLACVLIFTGCAWTIRPPSDLSQPTTVFLTEYNRHTRLALPTREGHWVEYGFGEWNYYGLEKRCLLSGLRAITGLGTAAYSRRIIPATASESEFLIRSGGSFTAGIEVEREAVESLESRLDAQWRKLGERATRQDGVPVARSPDDIYHLFHNSNHVSATWLEDLGCEVRGVSILSNFKVLE